MRSSNHFRIAVLPGDGIGKEVMSACIEVLDTIQRRLGGFKLDLEYIHADSITGKNGNPKMVRTSHGKH